MRRNIEEQVSRFSDKAFQFYQEGKYEQAIRLAKRTVKFTAQHLGKKHLDYATALDNLALVYRTINQNTLAEPLYREALGIYRAALGERHPRFAASLLNLADVNAALGNYAAAEPLLRELLELHRATLGTRHPAVAADLDNLGKLYRTTGRDTEAAPLYQEALEIYRTILSGSDPEYVTRLNDLAALYRDMGEYARAEPLLREALDILRSALGKHPNVAAAMNNLAVLYRQMGNYSAAEPLYQQALDIERSTLGDDDPDVARTTHNLAGLYDAMANYAAAEPLYRQALAVRRRVLDRHHPDIAASLEALASLYAEIGNDVAAEPLLCELLELLRTVLGERHSEVAHWLENLGGLYERMNRHTEAEMVLRQALETYRVALGERDLAVANACNSLAVLYFTIGRYAEAEPLYKKALEIRREALGQRHADVAVLLNNLAVLYHTTHNYPAAESFHQQTLELRRTLFGEEHPDVGMSLANLGALYNTMGNYVAAEPRLRRGLEIERRALGEQHENVALCLNNLAELYRNMGRYAEAIPLFEKALDIQQVVLGEKHADVATTLNNLASIYHAIGNSSVARSLYEQALEIRLAVYGELHPLTAQSMHNLAVLDWDTLDAGPTIRFLRAQALRMPPSELQGAVDLSVRALMIRRKVLGETNLAVASSLAVLAGKYRQMGLYDKAEQLLQQEQEIRGTVQGDAHPHFALTLVSRARLYCDMGRYDAAEPLCRQGLDIQRRALGDCHPEIAQTLNVLVRLCAASQRINEALQLAREINEIDGHIIGQIFSIGSESQRMAYITTLKQHFDIFLSLVAQHFPNYPTVVQAAVDLVLRHKAIGMEALVIQRETVLGGRYPALQSKLQQLMTLRMQIGQKALSGPGAEGPDEHGRLLAQWNAAKDRLEAELARQIPEMKLDQRLQAANRQTIATKLPANAILIEFVHFNLYDFQAVPARGEDNWRPPRYLAFILKSGEPDNVWMIDLGEADPIDQMIARFVTAPLGNVEPLADRHLTPAAEESVRRDIAVEAVALRKTIFDPLVALFGGSTRLFIAPDGDLNRLPFEVMPTNDGAYIIDDYHISYLGVGRDVLRFGTVPGVQCSAALVAADPNFDLAAGGEAAHKETVGQAERQSRDLPRSSMHFGRLPGTRVEGEQIAALLNVQPLLDDAVLERRLKSYKSPRLFHLATHGFFFPNQRCDPSLEPPRIPIATTLFDGRLGRLSQLESPLLRSGLVLAGVNTWLHEGQLPAEAEDAILNAEDVTGLDLRGTELVVLSACDTGLGDVYVGEGVYGLRRAFVLAGAKTLVMSLWKVPDQQTQELMVDFYRRLLRGEPRAEALRAAQLALRKCYPNPRYWGAFICQGDPELLPALMLRRQYGDKEKR